SLINQRFSKGSNQSCKWQFLNSQSFARPDSINLLLFRCGQLASPDHSTTCPTPGARPLD
ncbi:MAG: hypothetical protein ACKO63_16765, partial [Nodosilinea sp.]